MAATGDSRPLDETQLTSQLRAWLTWARKRRLSGKLAMALAVAVGICGFATYAAWTGSELLDTNPRTVLVLLVVDLVLLLSLGALVARQLVRIWVQRKAGLAGSRLHLRFVALFSLVAVAPAIITAVFSATFFHLGVQNWFSERISGAVQEALAVAEAYVAEHRNTIRADVLAMANDINRTAPRLARNPTLFNRVLQTQIALRSLSEATIFDSSGRILARTALSLAATFDTVPLEAVDQAREGQVVIFASDNEDQVQALVKLEAFLDAYLYVGRFVDPVVLAHVEGTRKAVASYNTLEGMRTNIELLSALIFIVVALMLLMVAVWLGLNFANRLARPIGELVSAAEAVRQGEFGARVAERDAVDEIGTLSRTFNRMTSQLDRQRSELIEANRQMDRRRRFTEAVLSGVSSGVIGLDPEGRVTLPNRTALELLGLEADALVGRPLDEVVPEFGPLLDAARAGNGRMVERQVRLQQSGGSGAILLARVGAERGEDGGRGFVLTFDDVTELLAAQRTAAWADVARRIAHEIKNPLTPIQLSAERLKRKYAREVSSDPDVFSRCIETIVRHVGDIGRMVDEFSSFARMPAPVMKPVDLRELAEEAVFAQRMVHGDIDYVTELGDEPALATGDARQIAQVLTNVLTNAADAIEGREADRAGLPRGRIVLSLERQPDRLVVAVQDNGRGLPEAERDRLTEPYVTTRAKGTGLGLAIVRKIMEDHGGRLALSDAPGGGAIVRLQFLTAAGPVEEAPDEEIAGGRVAHGA